MCSFIFSKALHPGQGYGGYEVSPGNAPWMGCQSITHSFTTKGTY